LTAPAQLERAVKRYQDVEAVREVTLALRSGEAVALVGANGAGKTTLMKLILGLVRPSAGSVRLLGTDPASRRGTAMRRQVGFLPESVVFDGALSGREILAFFARLKGLSADAGMPLLERLGLGPAAGRRLSTYSKGMRQRVGLAQAFMGEPRLLLLDEPTTGLDPELRRDFYRLVQEAQTAGAAILLSSHALAELEGAADRLALMDGGRLVACGTLPELRRISTLPSRIRVTMPDDRIAALPPRLCALSAGPRKVDVEIANGSKLDVLRELADLDAGIEDIEILTPSLDAVMAELRRREPVS
jgi:Cu-processing system ATP-binding protein